MKDFEVSDALIGKKIKFEKEVLVFTGEKINYVLEGEIIGVTKTDSFIDITVVRDCGLPYKSSVEHIGINYDSGYNSLESAKLID